MTPYWELEMLIEIERESASWSFVFYEEKFFPFINSDIIYLNKLIPNTSKE
jgi:hypothetical protein